MVWKKMEVSCVGLSGELIKQAQFCWNDDFSDYATDANIYASEHNSFPSELASE